MELFCSQNKNNVAYVHFLRIIVDTQFLMHIVW